MRVRTSNTVLQGEPTGIEAELTDPAGLWEALLPQGAAPARLRARDRATPTGTRSRSATRTRSCRRSASSTSTSSPRAATSTSTSALGAHVRELDGVVRHGLRGLGAERALGQRSSATSTPGTGACTRCARSARPASGSCSSPASAPGRSYKFEIRDAGRPPAPEGRPAGLPAAELPPANALGRLRSDSTSGATTPGSSAHARVRPAARPALDLRGPPRLVAAQPARGATAR